MRGNEEDDVEVKRTVEMSKVVIGRGLSVPCRYVIVVLYVRSDSSGGV
jgi:hypothetical protein